MTNKVVAVGPTDWLAAVDHISATFVGTLDYTFRIKATDNVSNTTTEWQVSQPVTVYGVTKYYAHGGSRACPEPVEGLPCDAGMRYTI